MNLQFLLGFLVGGAVMTVFLTIFFVNSLKRYVYIEDDEEMYKNDGK